MITISAYPRGNEPRNAADKHYQMSVTLQFTGMKARRKCDSSPFSESRYRYKHPDLLSQFFANTGCTAKTEQYPRKNTRVNYASSVLVGSASWHNAERNRKSVTAAGYPVTQRGRIHCRVMVTRESFRPLAQRQLALITAVPASEWRRLWSPGLWHEARGRLSVASSALRRHLRPGTGRWVHAPWSCVLPASW